MAGHSKWNNIKRKKAANDDRRGKLWSKLARNVIVAAKNGGGDPNMNLALRYAIEKAKAANMPTDTIDKAVKKGTGELGGAEYVPAVYEGYGAAGVAVIVDVLTDNVNRTGPEIKKIFERGGGKLGPANCVGWNFQTKGILIIQCGDADENTLMEIALESGADDVKREGDIFEVSCEAQAFDGVKRALEEKQIALQSADISKIPGSTIEVDQRSGAKILRLIEAFEEHDDVQNVYSNFEMSEEVMAQLQ